MIPTNVNKGFSASRNQRHTNENMQSQDINQKQPHKLQKDNVVPF